MEKISIEQPNTKDENVSKRQAEFSSQLLSADSILRARSPSTLSNFSVDDRGRLPSERTDGIRRNPMGIREGLKAFWVRNKGLALVLAAQIFNCLMNVIITILEIEGNQGKGFHPLQVGLSSLLLNSFSAYIDRFYLYEWESPLFSHLPIWQFRKSGIFR